MFEIDDSEFKENSKLDSTQLNRNNICSNQIQTTLKRNKRDKDNITNIKLNESIVPNDYSYKMSTLQETNPFDDNKEKDKERHNLWKYAFKDDDYHDAMQQNINFKNETNSCRIPKSITDDLNKETFIPHKLDSKSNLNFNENAINESNDENNEIKQYLKEKNKLRNIEAKEKK